MSLRSKLRSAPVAALLSFLLPGLGQAAAGAYRRAALVVLPAIAVVLIVVKIGLKGFEEGVVKPDFLTAFLVADLALLAYHCWAIVDAYRTAARLRAGALADGAGPRSAEDWSPRATSPGGFRRTRSPFGLTAVAVLLAVTVGVHGAIALPTVQMQGILSGVFANMPNFLAEGSDEASETPPVVIDESPDATATAPTGPTDSAAPTPTDTPTPTPAPLPTDWANDGRLNLLIIGSDAGQGRHGLRPDTMILLTVDLATGRSAMIGIPRNLENVPLPAPSASAFRCRCFPDMLNALYLEAMTYPKYFPGGEQRGFRALEGAIGTLTGLKVDGSVLVNLMGFVNLVDALGGLDINVPEKVVDKPGMHAGYEGYVPPEGKGHISFTINPGPQHMDGHVALQYARSRAQDWDYARMVRQQIVLLALRKQIAHPCSLVPRIPFILDAITKNGGAFWTNLPIEAAPALLSVAEKVGAGNAASITLDPATTGAVCNADRSNCDTLTAAAISNIRYIARHALDKVAAPSAAPTGGGGFHC